jgi:hypothetical protein
MGSLADVRFQPVPARDQLYTKTAFGSPVPLLCAHKESARVWQFSDSLVAKRSSADQRADASLVAKPVASSMARPKGKQSCWGAIAPIRLRSQLGRRPLGEITAPFS